MSPTISKCGKSCACAACTKKSDDDVFETDDEGVERKPRTQPVFLHDAGPSIHKAVEEWDFLVKGGPGGGGWQPIPEGKKGGFRRPSGTGFEYWYPEKGEGKEARPATHEYHEELKDYNLSVIAQAQGSLSPDDIKRAKDVASKMKEGIDKSADVCKLSPPVCKGNLGIPRMHMPQIMEKSIKEMLQSSDPEDRKKAHAAIAAGADANSDKSIKDQFLDSLKFKGVKISEEEVPVGQLKATQREIKAGKTFGMADSFLRGKYRPQDAQIIVSSDNHILDGHHRWASLVTAAPDTKMKVLRVDMPMKEFLRQSFQQAGVFRADLQGDIVDPSVPLDLSGNNTEDVNKDIPSKPAPAKMTPEQADQHTDPHPERPQAKGAEMAAKSVIDEWDDLIKAEGDRGGKVIGHTSSGKPIYEGRYTANTFGVEHSHYTKQDHLDASKAHDSLIGSGKTKQPAAYHINMADAHMKAAMAVPPEGKNPGKLAGAYKQSYIAAGDAAHKAAHAFDIRGTGLQPMPKVKMTPQEQRESDRYNAAMDRPQHDVGTAADAEDVGRARRQKQADRQLTAKSQDHNVKEITMFDPLALIKGEVSREEMERARDTFAVEDDLNKSKAKPKGEPMEKFSPTAFSPTAAGGSTTALSASEEPNDDKFEADDEEETKKSERDTLDLVKGTRLTPTGSTVRTGSITMKVAPPAVLRPTRSNPGLLPPKRILDLGRQHGDPAQSHQRATRSSNGTLMDPRSGLLNKAASEDEDHLAKNKREPADYFRTVAHNDIPFTGKPGKGKQVGGYPVGKHHTDPKATKKKTGFNGHPKDEEDEGKGGVIADLARIANDARKGTRKGKRTRKSEDTFTVE